MIKSVTNPYINDILVDESTSAVKEMTYHLKRFGLIAKPPESLNGGVAPGFT